MCILILLLKLNVIFYIFLNLILYKQKLITIKKMFQKIRKNYKSRRNHLSSPWVWPA